MACLPVSPRAQVKKNVVPFGRGHKCKKQKQSVQVPSQAPSKKSCDIIFCSRIFTAKPVLYVSLQAARGPGARACPLRKPLFAVLNKKYQSPGLQKA
jgi:hypothetical protein